MVPTRGPKAPTLLDIKIAEFRRISGIEEILAAHSGWDDLGRYCAEILDRIGIHPDRTYAWATPRCMARITVVVRFWNEQDYATRAGAAWILNHYFSDLSPQ